MLRTSGSSVPTAGTSGFPSRSTRFSVFCRVPQGLAAPELHLSYIHHPLESERTENCI